MSTNNNFVELSRGIVNINNIVRLTNDSELSFVNGESIIITPSDRSKLIKAIFGESTEEAAAPAETTATTTTTNLSFYKNLVKRITELNKSKYHKFRVSINDNVITIKQDGFNRMDEYTLEGVCISNGLREDDVNQVVAECL